MEKIGNMALPTPKIVPKASALFLPYEIELYQRWRKSALGIAAENDDDVLLPTAFEYMDFLEWRARQCSKLDGTQEAESKSPDPAFSGYVLAERCGHPLHPGDPRPDALRQPKDDAEEENEEEGEEQDTIAWCSMCLLQIHLKLLAELWDKWLNSGGPWRVLRPGSTAEGWQIAKRAYYMRKTNLVNDVDNLEDVARLEDTWEAAHPAADVEVVRAYSAKTAVDVYAKGVQFPARVAGPDEVAPRTPTGKERKKRLSYSPDTPEDTRHRSSAAFARRCLAYDPESPHRCPEEDGWAETSFKNSWEYNVRQCRTLLCNKSPNEPDVTYRELADEASKDTLINGIEEWLGKMQDDWKQPWVDILLATTEMFLVWQDPRHDDDADTDFNNWDRTETLVGTNLEAYARQIGDIDEEDETELVQAEVTEDFFDQDSVASDSDSDSDEDEDELPDPMDLEEDEEVAISVDE
ncbi:hypothetical protein J4E83_002158 [Alternaria metachromatica]|uniref:uncharacterized protein n=1 Tax=Alternaria metachromatica TaxID=283354 RepID=UPI0020C35948|nr:uncharacterized protein J4E83_002158 [Alternaria metachromatica]KAI4634836.1 hypothetical protein J4E83_002158 [Alternaria metachromatica]